MAKQKDLTPSQEENAELYNHFKTKEDFKKAHEIFLRPQNKVQHKKSITWVFGVDTILNHVSKRSPSFTEHKRWNACYHYALAVNNFTKLVDELFDEFWVKNDGSVSSNFDLDKLEQAKQELIDNQKHFVSAFSGERNINCDDFINKYKELKNIRDVASSSFIKYCMIGNIHEDKNQDISWLVARCGELKNSAYGADAVADKVKIYRDIVRTEIDISSKFDENFLAKNLNQFIYGDINSVEIFSEICASLNKFEITNFNSTLKSIKKELLADGDEILTHIFQFYDDAMTEIYAYSFLKKTLSKAESGIVKVTDRNEFNCYQFAKDYLVLCNTLKQELKNFKCYSYIVKSAENVENLLSPICEEIDLRELEAFVNMNDFNKGFMESLYPGYVETMTARVKAKQEILNNRLIKRGELD